LIYETPPRVTAIDPSLLHSLHDADRLFQALRAARDVAHDFWVSVQGVQTVHVGVGERFETQASGSELRHRAKAIRLGNL
jgi:hypothetical protein